MKNNLSYKLFALATGFILLITAACSAKTSPTPSLAAPTQTNKPTETQTKTSLAITATRTRRVKATNTPLVGHALPSVTLVQQAGIPATPTAAANTNAPTPTLPDSSEVFTPTHAPTRTPIPSRTQTPSATSAFTPGPSPTGLTPTSRITPTPTPIQNNGAINLQDGLGRMVHLAGPAMRVVSLAPSNSEILYQIGAWTQMVGRDELSDYNDDVLSLPNVGGSFGNFDLSAIDNLHPDLVLMAGINDPNLVPVLVSHGLTVFYLANPTNLEGLYANMSTVAALTSHVDENDALVNSLRQRMGVLQEILAAAENRPKVFVELDGSDPANPWTCGPGSYLDAMITLAGGQNIGAILTSPWGQMSTVQIVAQNPDVIILADSRYGMTASDVSIRVGWENITAVLDYNIIPFDDNLISRPGPRLVDGAESLAEAIHPELLPPINNP